MGGQSRTGWLVGGYNQLVFNHADHVGLDDGFEAAFHAGGAVGLGGEEVGAQQGVGGVAVEGGGAAAVELQHIVAFDILVDAVAVVDGPRGFVAVEEVFAEGEVGFGVAEGAQEGGHDVDLLGHAVEDAGGQLAAGVVDGDGDFEQAEGGEAFGALELVGVVGGDDEEGVVEPGLLASGGEEAAQGVVGVADGDVDGECALREASLVALRHDEGVVRRGAEEARHEGFFELFAEGEGHVLHEFLVPDGPVSVEVVASVEAFVVAVVAQSEVVAEAGAACEGLEAHRAVGCAVEEGGAVALAPEAVGQAAEVVERCGGEDEGFDEEGERGEGGGHGVDALAAIGEGVAPGEGVGQERVEEGGVGGRRWEGGGGRLGGVVVPYVFAGEAFHDEYDHVASAADEGFELGRRSVDGREEGVHLVGCHVVRVGEGVLADGTDNGEGGVEHDGCLLGRVDVLVGVADGDGASVACEATAHGEDGHGDGHQQCQRLTEVVVFSVQ